MMKVIKWLLVLVVLLAVVVGVLVWTGLAGQLGLRALSFMYGPAGAFVAAEAPPAPDYADAKNWGSLPDQSDAADWVPAGVAPGVTQGEAGVDVFYVHPTGFLTGSSWLSTMNPDSAAEENTTWMLAHQASAFNGCCNVYAPRYREASIFAYFADPATKAAVMEVAYGDVVRAFEHYLAEFNDGRPFILASHSQGTHHGLRLLRDHIAGTPLAQRLVAAYLIGGVMDPVTLPYLESLPGIDACTTPTDLGCVIAWDTYGDGGNAGERNDVPALCTNPLTWRVDQTLAPAAENRGALLAAWPYVLDFADDSPRRQVTDALPAPLAGHTWAQCRGSVLYIADQSDTAFAFDQPFDDQSRSYHAYDYAMFYMNIRDNAMDRADAWLARHGSPQEPPLESVPASDVAR
ncbi:MAG: DUF3089 domain-containing protein [Pseudomonadales bacterium]